VSRILVLDDKQGMREMVETVLRLEHEVRSFADPAAGLEVFAHEPFDVVVTDVRMPSLDGVEVLRRVKVLAPDVEVILMTGYGTVAQAVLAMRLGASDYLMKPFEPAEVAVAVEKALEHRALATRAASIDRAAGPLRGVDRIIGTSAATAEVRRLVQKVAPSDATVLLTGPSGTGKELVAQAMHECSPRAGKPFVVVHCATLPRELTESELFGHMKGAFSGAVSAKRGMVDEAEGGVLYLDDINYLEVGLQAKVNRLIQEKQVKPVGATVWKRVDIRIIASANVDLEAAMRRGEFREDLYYRLNVFALRLPPLVDRPGDASVLARHFVQRLGPRLGKPGVSLSAAALAAIDAAPWPGNVRQIENAIERALILVEGDAIEVEHLPELIPRARAASGRACEVAAPNLHISYAEHVERASAAAGRDYMQALLAQDPSNVTRAAERAGMSRQHLYRILRKLGLADPEPGDDPRAPGHEG